MKKLKLLSLILILFSTFMGCEKDDALPISENPEIILESNEIYGGTNRKFEIKALLKDDLGLETIDINIPELDLEKRITFSENPLTKEYNLNYKANKGLDWFVEGLEPTDLEGVKNV